MRGVVTIIWMMGAAFVLTAAFLIAKRMRTRRTLHAVTALVDSREPRQTDETDPRVPDTHEAVVSYEDLAALMIELDPQPDEAAVREKEARMSDFHSGKLGPWPGARQEKRLRKTGSSS